VFPCIERVHAGRMPGPDLLARFARRTADAPTTPGALAHEVLSAPIHGHEGEKCWARVQTGELKICNYVEINRDPLSLEKIQEFECHPGFLDGPADIHSVENLSDSFATSLHIYAKPYEECELFDTERGTITKAKMDYHSIDSVLCNN